VDDAELPTPGPVARRPSLTRPRTVLGLVLALGVGAVVFSFQASLVVGLGQFAVGGYGLQEHLSKAADGLTSGDYDAGAREQASARSSVDRLAASTEGMAVDVISRIPGLDLAVANWQQSIRAADAITTATGELITLYGDLSGKSGTSKIFQDGAIDLTLLDRVPGQVTDVQKNLRQARKALNSIETTTAATQPLGAFRDQALQEMEPVQVAVDALVDIAPLLPQALGSDAPRRYLVAIGNQAEMRASFGAPLSLVMVEFDNGEISIPIRGQTSTELFPPLNAPVEWYGPALNPFFPGNTRFRPFVVTNTHPNLLFSAQEMAAAWEGGGFPRVDGIIALDLTAIAAVLEATGPIESPVYGQVNGERLGELLLVEAYQQFGQDDALARQAANQELLDQLLTRLLSGDDLITVAQAIASTAPGRHFQVWMRERSMQLLAMQSQVAGVVADPGIGDWAAVYTQNGNQSKVDVFQQRNILKQVFLQPDGSATINQIITTTNATPADRPEGPPERIGYETSWLKNAYLIYSPPNATNKRVAYPNGFTVRPFKGHARDQLGGGWVDDGFGYPLIRVVGWTPPGGESVISVTYDMPPGTFVSGDLPEDADLSSLDAVEYRVQAEPQALFEDQTLTVQVYPPPGWRVVTYPGMKVEDGAGIVSAVVSGPTRIGISAVR
jgi:hypothetical protein